MIIEMVLNVKKFDNNMLQTSSKIIIKIMLIYGLYVLFHGKIAPGGGFQSGAIWGIALIFHVMIIGRSSLPKMISNKFLDITMASGVLLYALCGWVGPLMLNEFNFLNYYALNNSPVGQQIGIMTVEIGVFFTVFAAIGKIYFDLTNFEEPK